MVLLIQLIPHYRVFNSWWAMKSMIYKQISDILAKLLMQSCTIVKKKTMLRLVHNQSFMTSLMTSATDWGSLHVVAYPLAILNARFTGSRSNLMFQIIHKKFILEEVACAGYAAQSTVTWKRVAAVVSLHGVEHDYASKELRGWKWTRCTLVLLYSSY